MNMKKLDLHVCYIFCLGLVALTIPLPMLLNNVAVILLVVFWFFLALKKQLKAPSIKPLLLMQIPYFILVVGAFYSTNHEQLLAELTKNIPFLLLPIVVFSVRYKIEASHFKYILKWFLLGNFIVSLILISHILKTLGIEGLSWTFLWNITHQKLSEVVGLNAIYLSLYFAICIIYILNEFLYVRTELSKPIKFFYLLSFILIAFGLVLLSSRTVIVSCAIVLAMLLFQYYLKKMHFLKVLFRLLIFGTIVSGAMFLINPVLKLRIKSVFFDEDFNNVALKEEGVQMRQKLWQSSYEVFSDHFLFGVGTGDFQDQLMATYKRNKYRVQYRFKMNSHNQYLSFMVSSGIFGTLLFLIYMFYPVARYIQHNKWMLLTITLLFVLCFLTESYLYTNKGVIIVSFFMTVMYRHNLDTNIAITK